MYCPTSSKMEERTQEEALVDMSLLIRSMEGVMNDPQGGGGPITIPIPMDEISALTESSLLLSDIYEPGANDVIFGLGPTSVCRIDSNHDGNRHFQQLINDYTELYQPTTEAEDLAVVVAEVVRVWRSLEPPGRFLVSSEPAVSPLPYHDIGDEDARRQTSQLLSGGDNATKHHRDDITASTTASSTVTTRRESTASGRQQLRRAAGPSEFFGGSFRGLLMSLFGQDSIMNQYLP